MDVIHWLLLLLLLVTGVFAGIAWLRNVRLVKQAETADRERSRTIEELGPLRMYAPIRDVDAEIARRRDVARSELERLADEGRETIAAAQTEAESTRAAAKEDRKRITSRAAEKEAQADRAVQAAAIESRAIVARAEQEARRIAGDAWTAREKELLLRRAAEAFERRIRGYGEEFVVPSQSVLDDLADEWDHKEAGRELKRARQRSESIVRSAQAADCDYREPARRETAIHFVLDAFNGKTDSILSRSKHDNYGTLQQEITDAFDAVNYLGSAFRNARITREYLDARLEELRWAVAARELQIRKREQEKAIREQIREEERARREYERELEKARKEEEALELAMEEAQRRVAAASETERSRLEAELEALRQQLADADARFERAKSMAEQTRRGHVYVISNLGSFGEDVYKIGLTRRLDPMDRVKELGDASVPFSFDVHAMIYADDAPTLESELHRRFTDRRVNVVNERKEFFRVTLSEIRSLVDEMGLEVHWTMAAEAAEYRESEAARRRRPTSPPPTSQVGGDPPSTDAALGSERRIDAAAHG